MIFLLQKPIVTMQAGETIEFDYFVSSEADYDFFRFYVNGECDFEFANLMEDWDHYVFTAPEDGEYTFMWRFEKDAAVEDGLDCAYIDNIAYSNGIMTLPGDVDFDGDVDASDALLVLRYVLGLVSFDDTTLAIADVNRDGVVDSADVIFILRMALAQS